MSMDLNALREFSAVVEEGSFAAAARRLETPKSTVSKRIQDLERDLGVTLIERSTRRLRLTQEGAIVLARAERILADAAEIAQSLDGTAGPLRGHLRIAAPQLFGQTFLGPLAAECRRRHPGLTLEIVLTDGQPDPEEDGFDAVIRLGRGSGALVCRPLFHSTSVLVAAPGALTAPPAHPRAIGDCPVVLHGIGLIQTWHLSDGRDEVFVRLAGGLGLSSYPGVHAAALSGAGLALLPEYLVADDIAAGRLLRHLPQWSSLPVELSLLHPAARTMTHRLRAFVDLLQEVFPAAAEPA
ncbi:LysR family transcriptional regulator [Mangrovicoccus algicola]|uniref:LysR family transcriptional regulator n=1 Tax=Mangrovicoccus algicola TaxID=2771008 RepID=A0A8J7CYU1_9RHOB|nr:LysR family transcriptional regulator [Mangrovicoccus algicola]MBE3636958.1 LysR family transcriptional regulator [Mangrovicoccus algicola]